MTAWQRLANFTKRDWQTDNWQEIGKLHLQTILDRYTLSNTITHKRSRRVNHIQCINLGFSNNIFDIYSLQIQGETNLINSQLVSAINGEKTVISDNSSNIYL